jgi:uncharacterized protein involved in exopolysaccharide biosynthesis
VPAVPERFGSLPATTATLGPEPVPFEIDLSAVATSLRVRSRAIVIGAIAGAALGASILLFVPPRFNSRAMLLIRTTQLDPMTAVKSKMGPLAELIPGALGGNTDEELSTELALLESRATMGAVVDSLRLQAVMRSPGRVPPATVIDSMRLEGRFKPVKAELIRGRNVFPFGIIWANQPAKVKLVDREDAIDELDKRLGVDKIAGNAIEIRYRGRDSVSAAGVANMVAATYMERRKTVDRGLNQRRLEFLVAKQDSVRTELRSAADLLAVTATRAGVGAAPEIGGRALAEQAAALEERLAEIRAAEIALDTLMSATRGGRLDALWLAGFPELLKSPGLNELLAQIGAVQTQRTVLLARVPESNPQARALDRARDSLLAQLPMLAASYRSSLAQVGASLQRDLQRVRDLLYRLPAQAAAVGKEEAEITRLAALNAGMGMQVLEARLAALLEGGDVRVIDPAISPRKVSFPRTVPTLLVCILLGLGAGIFYALLGLRRTYVPSPTRTA